MGVTKPYPDDDSNATNHKLVSFQGRYKKTWKRPGTQSSQQNHTNSLKRLRRIKTCGLETDPTALSGLCHRRDDAELLFYDAEEELASLLTVLEGKSCSVTWFR